MQLKVRHEGYWVCVVAKVTYAFYFATMYEILVNHT